MNRFYLVDALRKGGWERQITETDTSGREIRKGLQSEGVEIFLVTEITEEEAENYVSMG